MKKITRFKYLLPTIAAVYSLSFPVGSQTISGDDCKENYLEAHRLVVMDMVNAMLQYNPEIRSQKFLLRAANANFLARKTFYYPNLNLGLQPYINYQQMGYSNTGIGIYNGPSNRKNAVNSDPVQATTNARSSSNYRYEYNQLINFTGQIELDILNLPKFKLMQSSWNQLKSAEKSTSNTVNNTALRLLNSYITAQSLRQALEDEQKVVDVYKKYTETQLQLLNKGFSSILEYNNQLGNYLTFQSKVNNTRIRLQEALEEIYEISAFRLESKDFAPLPSPSCLPALEAIDRLSTDISQYFEPIKENIYTARAYQDLAQSEIYQYLPRLSIGYTLSYYEQYGNISGSDNQVYTQLTSYPYLRFSLAFNLGGRELHDANKNKQISKNFVEQSSNAHNQAQRDLSVSITRFQYNQLNYQNYKELKQQTLEVIKATQNAMVTGLIDFSLFLSSQSLLFLGIENESNSLIESYQSYFKVKRLTTNFIDSTTKIFFPK